MSSWRFSEGLLAVCLLVFQAGNIVHGLDLSTHDLGSDCEICGLFAASNDDIDAIPATNTAIDVGSAPLGSTSFEIAIGSSRLDALRIRAPPFSS